MSKNETEIINLLYEPTEHEYLGSKEKFWFHDKSSDQNGLFKIGRNLTGENWSEFISSQLAKLINIPAVEYHLALWKGKQGTICYSMNDNNQLLLGNVILPAITSYPVHQSDTRFLKVPEYTLQIVLECNSHPKLKLPVGFIENKITTKAIHVFIGYLLFDTWIGNTDRHHENWAWILHDIENVLYLAPTFDHASSLGRELTDESKFDKIKRKNINTYSIKARTPFYGDVRQAKTLTTHEIAEILFLQFPEQSTYWVNKILEVSDEQISETFSTVPTDFITETSIDFAKQLLYLNKTFLSDLMLGKQ